MAARNRKIRHDENTREKIRAGMLIHRLQEHIEGKRDMASTQVSAALGLLRKTLPDLANQTIEHSGEVALERIERVIIGEKIPAITAPESVPGVTVVDVKPVALEPINDAAGAITYMKA